MTVSFVKRNLSTPIFVSAFVRLLHSSTSLELRSLLFHADPPGVCAVVDLIDPRRSNPAPGVTD